ncbi:MAG: HDOD domain-containing protein [Gammaproteobacteria bacterium]|nr:HDOD domain-containing protein [Gammaproteobacteria bacterium]
MASINLTNITEIRGREKLDFLVSEVDKLVTMPEIYYRLNSVLESQVNNLDDISTLLSTDPGLCARLLRMANSAFYSFPARIESIKRAIGTVGLRQLREMVLATSIVDAFSGIPIDRVDMRKFWEHSIAVGVMSRAIARYVGLSGVERFYICGLLHDIGRLVLYLKLPCIMSEMLEQASRQQDMLYTLEQQQLDYNHADVGGHLLARWKVPRSIYEAVSYHHDPTQAQEFSQLACAVHIADAWVNCQSLGSSGEPSHPTICNDAMQVLNLQKDGLEEVWVTAADEVVDIVNQFLKH